MKLILTPPGVLTCSLPGLPEALAAQRGVGLTFFYVVKVLPGYP
jgi:hypothetical protein